MSCFQAFKVMGSKEGIGRPRYRGGKKQQGVIVLMATNMETL